jgi:hypothetical protein
MVHRLPLSRPTYPQAFTHERAGKHPARLRPPLQYSERYKIIFAVISVSISILDNRLWMQLEKGYIVFQEN